MEKLRISMFAIASLFTLASQAQTLDELVDKHLEAMGGKDKLSTLNSVKLESNLSVQGMEIPVVTIRVHNVAQRVDISAMGMNGYIINTPTAGWTYMPFMGQTAAEAMPEDQVKEGSEELDIQGLLMNYKEKGHTVELVGKEDVDGTECHKLKVTSKGGRVRTLYLEGKNFYIIRSVQKATVMGQEQEVTINYGDFKKTEEGYVFAHSIGGAFGQGDMVITKVEVNKPVDAALFKPSN